MTSDGPDVRSIYLCGPINKRTDEEAHRWRDQVERTLSGKYRFLNPMRRDYRQREADFVTEIVEQDYQDIRDADIVLVLAHQATWGTAMEMHQAFQVDRKLVLVVCSDPAPSPWLRYHCHFLFSTLDEAIDWLRALEANLL